MIDLNKINPDSSALSAYFSENTKVFFNKDGAFNMKYFEDARCYYCNNSTYGNEFRDQYGFRHVRCSVCGMVYVNPRLKEEVSNNLYSENYYAQSYKIKLLPNLDYRRNVLGLNKYNQVVGMLGRKNGRVLDLGCGLGDILSIFKENGWDTLGVELNHFAANYAKENFGIPVINQSIYDFNERDKFDVVMLWGVLEHVYEPLELLNKCRRLLSENSLLVLEVPSGDSFLVRYVECTGKKVDRIIEGDKHLMLFSVSSFKGMLEKGGFVCKKLLSNGLDIATMNRASFFENRIPDEQVNIIQSALDESMQGDLLRGFFKKKG